MNRNFGAAAAMVALFSTTTLSACNHSAPTPLGRKLPDVSLVIPEPDPRPKFRAGDDARLLAAEALAYGDANSRKLEAARRTYQSIASEISGL